MTEFIRLFPSPGGLWKCGYWDSDLETIILGSQNNDITPQHLPSFSSPFLCEDSALMAAWGPDHRAHVGDHWSIQRQTGRGRGRASPAEWPVPSSGTASFEIIDGKFWEQPRVFLGPQVNYICTFYAFTQVFSGGGPQVGDSILQHCQCSYLAP